MKMRAFPSQLRFFKGVFKTFWTFSHMHPQNFAKIDFPFYFLEEICDDKTQPEKTADFFLRY
jgi:hypothetical protein